MSSRGRIVKDCIKVLRELQKRLEKKKKRISRKVNPGQ